MDLRQLRHFIAVAEEEHFSRAAKRANIVQSALSTSIRSLEQELGVQLFVRTTRQVRLTEAGRVLLEHARIVMDAAREAKEAVARVSDLERASLHLGAVPSLPPFLDLASLLAQFRDRFPSVDVHLIQGNSAQLLERVAEGKLDIAILPMAEPQPGVDTITLSREPLVAVCPLRHPLAGRRSVELGDLAGESFVDFEQGWAVRQLIDRAFEAAGVPRQTAFEVSDLVTMLALVERGLGIALVPRTVARRPKLAMVPLADPQIIWELAAVYPATGNGMKAAPSAFLDMLAQQVR